ncbi:energy-coupling factor transport system ATP-binding protein [Acetivibrio thermocellus AD2]|uniref:Energy-coupling factor transport system ATP-binding protein n=1 Tax=Acetivibrio thermocellus AD2 TaxID=1138384 RepID=A0AB36TFW9_ACETH|nr:energy-coupling factor transporter ATPase [Acetivibrio thermocellus]ADU73565.1 Cobalt ATP-binding cassette-like protein [Acetivibrio thermocellus DSM 1313]ALX07486.1 Polyamine-transporting ATPase [Acetivibrio thermocellus AD2]ANV75225.1 Polyamine-transporting ATPase [Acetivibrio thermocellus DSM 2360]EIC03418.1 ABC transporter related protein [Acetivibrio thermocellus YS]PFH01750.1 energy-coupling factor transport system ATP-binding protein [Acetivibrio thermocellus AD2]
MKDIIVKANDVEYAYKKNSDETPKVLVLKELNTEICEGEFVAVIGRNGSGKSTFARLLNAILIPTRGVLYIGGKETYTEANLWEIRRTVGMVFQNPDNQIIATSVEEDVAFGPENIGIPSDEIVKRVEEALRSVGLEEYKKASPHHLSGGQKQRVAIAGILAMKPKCIVLDEATSMLDPSGRKEVLKVLRYLNEKENITIIHITHYMEEAMLAKRILVMDEGKIVMDGNPRQIFSKVEEIKALGLDVPQVAELFHELKKDGYNVPDNILTVEEAVQCLAEMIAKA